MVENGKYLQLQGTVKEYNTNKKYKTWDGIFVCPPKKVGFHPPFDQVMVSPHDFVSTSSLVIAG